MLSYPSFNPIALTLGPLQVRWYGIMYIIAFLTAWCLARVLYPRLGADWSKPQVDDMIFYGALGAVLGGRIGYMLFYAGSDFFAHPLDLFKVWQGGMSFHGGLLGLIASLGLFSVLNGKRLSQVLDFVTPLAPLGLAVGRLGNFINGELWGRVTNVPWAMVFPQAGPFPRHPSQLYELFCEGIILFVVLWWYSAKPRPAMAVAWLFLLLYGCVRFSLEFFREPDFQKGFIAFDWLTMGQLLSLPMIIMGVVGLIVAYRRANKVSL